MGMPIELLNAFGLIFGYVYPDLLVSLGVDRKYSHSTLAIFVLALMCLAGFIASPIAVYGIFILAPISEFYTSELFWITVWMVIGGFAHLGQHLLFEKVINKKRGK